MPHRIKAILEAKGGQTWHNQDAPNKEAGE